MTTKTINSHPSVLTSSMNFPILNPLMNETQVPSALTTRTSTNFHSHISYFPPMRSFPFNINVSTFIQDISPLI